MVIYMRVAVTHKNRIVIYTLIEIFYARVLNSQTGDLEYVAVLKKRVGPKDMDVALM